MILDKLSESAKYEAMHPLFHEAFEFLKTAGEKENGRHELSSGMYVNIMDAKTHSPGKIMFEAHRQYIDIQYLFDGHSAFIWAHTPDLTVKTPYDAEKDVEFLSGDGNAVQVKGGEFYILWPEDAHEPHRTSGMPSAYRVAVVKVPV